MDDNWYTCTMEQLHINREWWFWFDLVYILYIHTYILQNYYTVLELFGLGSTLISRLRANSCSGVPGGKAEL